LGLMGFFGNLGRAIKRQRDALKCFGKYYWICITGTPSQVYGHGCWVAGLEGGAAYIGGIISATAFVALGGWIIGAGIGLCVMCILVGDYAAMNKLYWGDFFD